MQDKISILGKQIDRKDLEKFTRKLYIYRQKDRLKDEEGNGVGNKAAKMTSKLKKKRVKTINIKIRKRIDNKEVIVHIATIRSDWDKSDFIKLREMFPDTFMRSASGTYPMWLFGEDYHDSGLKNIFRKKWL